MGKRTIEDVEYVADAMIIGYLRAAAVNYEHAHKEFKRHHYELKDSDAAKTFEVVRQLSERTLREICEFCNDKIHSRRLERDRKAMSGGHRMCPRKSVRRHA